MTAGRGSETGSGNEAHRSPGESGQAEGEGYAEKPYEDFDPELPRPYPHPASPDEEAGGKQRDQVRKIGNHGPA